MAWQGILGHDDVARQFLRAIQRGRLGSTFLFAGPVGIGKRAFANQLAKSLLCRYTDENLLACGNCDSCVQADSRTHPDLLIVEKPPDRTTIPVAAFIGDDQHRMREGLCHDVGLRPFMGGRKVAIIDDADYLNEEGANCLLKTLEEPPPRSVLILISSSADRQLPTIRSRAQLIRFRPLSEADVCEVLLAQRLAADEVSARRMAATAGGSVQRALQLADDALWDFRGTLLDALAAGQRRLPALAAELVSFVDAAGKEAPPRRARARQVLEFAVEFYRQLLRSLAGAEPRGDEHLLAALRKADTWPGDAETATACIERTLEAFAHIDRNAHLPTLLECWLDDLSRIVESGHAVPGYGEL